MIEHQADVVVIGAGAAGLMAAKVLGDAGRKVVLLEARDYAGGRMRSEYPVGSDVPMDLGAEFVHGRSPVTFGLVKQFRLPLVEIDWDGVKMKDGQPEDAVDFWQQVDTIFDRMKNAGETDLSFRAFLDSVTDEDLQAAKPAATAYVEGFNAAEADRISVQSLVQGEQAAASIDGERQFRFPGGYGGFVKALAASVHAERVHLRTGTVVTRVEWQPGNVSVETGRERWKAPAAVITLPLGVWQAPAGEEGTIEFVPALDEKQAAARQLIMGQVVRIALRFRTPFWEAKVPYITFLRTEDEHFPTWWSLYPLTSPVLIGWAASRYADRMASCDAQGVAEHAVQALAGAFGMSPAEIWDQVESWHYHDWRHDPYSRGAYSYVGVGGMDAPGRLAEPVADTLFFAGEATCTDGHASTVHGALATGMRAANEVLARQG